MTIKGNTRMQKYGFLTAQLYRNELKNLDFYSDWIAYDYGPWSSDLTNDIRIGIANNLIQIQTEKTTNNRTLSNYSLKIKGRKRLNELSKNYHDVIKDLYEKFTKLNFQSTNKILKDIYESYPEFILKSTIKEDVLKHETAQIKEQDENLNRQIKQKIESIQSGNIKSKKYTVTEYLAHVDQVLQD